ncbi:ABC transporter ATP-binding protein [Youngiibacter multivorans]|uniref:ABC-2 type transport system ATP-binding protein n=1 Tax=Youngiibacter multivorans TaxID=937251 RepID=A0ABS4G7D2_9CLOT|nr:ABC transporter ATP-binding protein [Youngiibacter multivorans]MBP1920478.1 ABC-2 type transport system ATP-binding protein [Youngiibacter multivorans]
MSVIVLEKLTKYYGKTRGIEDLTFDVKEGEIFGFIGPNGAGKSTTIRTLLSLIRPTSGKATIFGMDIVKDAPEIAKNVGYLPSEVFYYDNMKVKELLNYSASFYKKDCSKRIKELSEVMDLDLDRKIEDLSFGNKKKVGIVQGLLHEPKLILLDEPTSGLDPLMQKKFFDLLEEENKKGATVLFSSHILGEVQKLCHRVAIIKDGRIIRLDNIENLRGETYKRFNIETEDKLYNGLLNLPGVDDVIKDEKSASFLYKGDINLVMKELSGLKLKNILIEEPSLEEVFMHYYEKGDES